MRALGDGVLLAEQTSQGPSVNLAVLALLYAGRLIEAQAAADATVRDARERGALLAHVEASYVRSLVLYARGQIAEAAADAQAAVDGMNWRWHGHPHRAVAALLDCMVERDELDEAARLIERAERELPAPTGRGTSHCCIACAHECIFGAGTRRCPSRRRGSGRRSSGLWRN